MLISRKFFIHNSTFAIRLQADKRILSRVPQNGPATKTRDLRDGAKGAHK